MHVLSYAANHSTYGVSYIHTKKLPKQRKERETGTQRAAASLTHILSTDTEI